MPVGKPQRQSPIGKEKLAQKLYPTPVSGRLAPLTSNPSDDTSRSADRLPWRKIALLGALTELPFAVVFYLFLHHADTFLGLYLLGVLPIGGFILLIILFVVSAGYLRKLGLESPRLTALASLLLLTPILTIFAAPLVLVPWPAIIVAFVICGALGFCLSAYIFEKARASMASIILAVFIVGPTILFWILGIYIKKTDTNGYYTNTLAKSVDWKLLPTPLPPGITDISDDVDGTHTCANVKVHFASYECLYRFDYPGYLSAKSQNIIDQAVAAGQIKLDEHLSPDIYITVLRDTKTLDSFKYHNGQCDINGITYANQLGTRQRDYTINLANARSAEPRKCGKTTTPSGKNLYYDSYPVNNSRYLPVPYNFYFQQKGNVVAMQVGNEQPLAGVINTVYFADPGYQTKVYELVDSFQ